MAQLQPQLLSDSLRGAADQWELLGNRVVNNAEVLGNILQAYNRMGALKTGLETRMGAWDGNENQNEHPVSS